MEKRQALFLVYTVGIVALAFWIGTIYEELEDFELTESKGLITRWIPPSDQANISPYVQGSSIILRDISPDCIFTLKIANTGSMEPLLFGESQAIYSSCVSISQLNVGDVITSRIGSKSFTHQVFEKGEDEKGEYVNTRGYNNWETDKERIYKDNLRGVLIGVIR